MIFNTNDKNQLLILGKTIDEYKKVFGNLNSSISDSGTKNSIFGKISAWWNGDTSKLIPDSELIPEISFEEAEKEIQAFNKAMSESGTTVGSYFADLENGNPHFKDFIQNTSDADRTAVNYQKSVKAAREEQLAQNAAVKQSGAAYKAAAIGMKALSVAGNMLLFMAISEAISLAVQGIDYLIHYEEKQEEKLENAIATAEEYADTIASVRDEMKETAETTEDIVDEFAKLSQGVNSFTNENKSLSTSNYERFLELSNQLAELYPSLTRGYDENGNAILSLSGDVDTVTASLKAMAEQSERIARQEIKDNLENYVNGDGDNKGQAYVIDKQAEKVAELQKQFEKLEKFESIFTNKFLTGDTLTHNERTIILNNTDLLGDEGTEAIGELLYESWTPDDNGNYYLSQITEEQATYLSGLMQNAYNTLYGELQSKKDELASQNSELSTNMMYWVEDLSVYKEGGQYLQSAISSMVNNIDWTVLNLEGADFDTLKNYLQENILSPLQAVCNDPESKVAVINALTSLFNLDMSEMPVDEMKSTVDEYINTLAQYLNKDADELKTILGFKSVDTVFNQYNAAIKSASEKWLGDNDYDFNWDSWFKENSINTEEEIDRWNEIAEAATDAAKAREEYIQGSFTSAGTFDVETFNDSIDEIQSAYSTLSDAVEEYNKYGSYSLDTLQSLLELKPEYLAYLIDENGNLNLNSEALKNLARIEIEETKAKIYSAMYDKVKALTANVTTDAIWSESVSLNDHVLSLYQEAEALGVNTQAQYEALEARQIASGVLKEQIDEATKEERAQLQALDALLLDVDGVFEGFGNTAEDTADKVAELNEELEDLAKSEALQAIQYKFDTLEQSITKVDNALSLLDTTSELINENDFVGKIDVTNRQLDLARTKASLLADEFEQLRNTEYDSADSAEELATRMETVINSLSENRQQIIEYGKDISSYYMSALTSISSLSKDTIDEATDILDRNIESLSQGGLTGLQFSLSPIVPESSLEKQRQENRSLEDEMQSYYDTLAEMQKIALDLQYQEQLESNAKERQELLDQLNDSKATLQTYSSDVQAIQKDTNEVTSKEQKADYKKKETETQSFSNSEQQILTSLNEWIKNNPIQAPDLDTSAWEDMVSQTESYAERIKKAVSGISDDVNNTYNSVWSSFFTNDGSALSRSSGSELVEKAKQYLGTPYVWGGNDTSGWDCSGFVNYMLGGQSVTGARTTQDQWKNDNGVRITDLSQLQAGDILYFGKDGTATHVAIYEGDGMMIHAANSKSGTIESDFFNSSYYLNRFLGAKRFAMGTPKGHRAAKNTMLIGETYQDEIIKYKDGSQEVVNTPTIRSKDDVDYVIGVKDTKKISYATGTPTTNSNYLEWIKEAAETFGVPANIIMSLIDQESSNGTAADTYTFNSAGAYGLTQLTQAVIDDLTQANSISQKYSSLLESMGVNIGNARGGGSAYDRDNILTGVAALAMFKERYLNNDDPTWAKSLGYYYAGGNYNGTDGQWYANSVLNRANSESFVNAANQLNTLVSNTSAIASSTSSIASVDFKTQLQNLLSDKSTDTSQKSVWEGDLLDYIAENTEIREDNTENLLSSWEKLQDYQEKQTELFRGYEQQLLNAAGSNSYVNLRNDISGATIDYTKAAIKASTDITVGNIKSTFDQAQDILDTILEYYRKRKAEGATADELNTIIESYSEQTEIVNDLSDSYVSALQSYTDFVTELAEREMQQYSDRISWQEKINDGLERQLEKTDDIAEKSSIVSDLIDNNNNQIEIYRDEQEKAHQGVLDLYDDETYAPIFEKYDLESWFDAEGNESAQFKTDLNEMSITHPELVPVMQEVFNQVQAYKQAWYEAEEGIADCEDEIYELNQTQSNLRVDAYTEMLDRLNDIETIRLNRQEAIISAMETQNSLSESLRSTMADVTEEVDANKHLSEWLDDDTRALLFNDDDYAAISKEIKSIQRDSDDLFADYQAQLATLTETTWYEEEAITAEYERQNEQLNERLENAQQELELAKKRTEYENTAKERNTRIIMGGRSVQVADPDTMYDLAKELSNLESEYKNTQITQSENEAVREQERLSDTISQEISAREKMIELIDGMTDSEKALFANSLPLLEEMTTAIALLSPTDIPWLNQNMMNYRNDISNMTDEEREVGYNLTVDYDALHDIIDKLFADGIISSYYADMLNAWAETTHNTKALSDVNTAQYPQTEEYGGKLGTPAFGQNYGSTAQSIQKQSEYISDYAAKLDALIQKRNSQGGWLSKSDLATAQWLETMRNRKIFNNGLDYAQTSDFGGLTFGTDLSDFSQSATDLQAFCQENGGLTDKEQQLIDLLNTYSEQEETRINDLLSIGVDVSDILGTIHNDLVNALAPLINSISKTAINPNSDNTANIGGIASANLINHYATGTKSASAGIAVTDEDGYEWKLKQIQNGNYTALGSGDVVFSKSATDNLWAFANNPTGYFSEQLKSLTADLTSGLPLIQNHTDVQTTEIHNHFTGDNIFTETIDNASDFVADLTRMASDRNDITKNMRR